MIVLKILQSVRSENFFITPALNVKQTMEYVVRYVKFRLSKDVELHLI